MKNFLLEAIQEHEIMEGALMWAQVLTPVALSILGLGFLGWSLWLKTIQRDWGKRVDTGFAANEEALSVIKSDVQDIKRRIDVHRENHNNLKIETVATTTELKVRVDTLQRLMDAVETTLKKTKGIDH